MSAEFDRASLFDRVPPQNLEAEQSTLGSILAGALSGKTDIAEKAVEKLLPQDFYREVHQRIFQTMRDLVNEGAPVDLITLAMRMRDENILDACGGAVYLTTLLDSVPTAANFDYYADQVLALAERRKLLDLSNILAEAVWEPFHWQTTLEKVKEDILGLGSPRTEEVKKGFQECLTELASEALTRTEDMEFRGIGTGFPQFDRKINGYRDGQLWLLGARPSMGKTALAFSEIQHIARSHWVDVFSCEMTVEELTWRLLGIAADVKINRLENKRLNDGEKSRLDRAYQDMKSWKLKIHSTPSLSPGQLRLISRRSQQAGQLEIVYIDHVGLMESNVRGSEYDKQSEVARQVRSIATELKVPVVGLIQLSRKVEERPNKRPMLSDFRESGHWEQNAHGAMALYRDAYYSRDPEGEEDDFPHDADRIILKNRGGQCGTVKMTFDPARTFFYEPMEGGRYGY